MRLIDADKLKNYMEQGALSLFLQGRYKELDIVSQMLNSFYKDIDEQLTAYDVDKVVEKLSNLESKITVDGEFLINESDAIEIVKAGGN